MIPSPSSSPTFFSLVICFSSIALPLTPGVWFLDYTTGTFARQISPNPAWRLSAESANPRNRGVCSLPERLVPGSVRGKASAVRPQGKPPQGQPANHRSQAEPGAHLLGRTRPITQGQVITALGESDAHQPQLVGLVGKSLPGGQYLPKRIVRPARSG